MVIEIAAFRARRQAPALQCKVYNGNSLTEVIIDLCAPYWRFGVKITSLHFMRAGPVTNTYTDMSFWSLVMVNRITCFCSLGNWREQGCFFFYLSDCRTKSKLFQTTYRDINHIYEWSRDKVRWNWMLPKQWQVKQVKHLWRGPTGL